MSDMAMLTRTSLSGIRILVKLALQDSDRPVAPRRLAAELQESPTYLAKVTGHLVRAGICQAHRGVLGGVSLSRPPREITLLDIVQACQGHLVGSFCSPGQDPVATCAFHRAGVELHQAMVEVLSRWTLEQIAAKPKPSHRDGHGSLCWIEYGAPGSLRSAAGAPGGVQQEA